MQTTVEAFRGRNADLVQIAAIEIEALLATPFLLADRRRELEKAPLDPKHPLASIQRGNELRHYVSLISSLVGLRPRRWQTDRCCGISASSWTPFRRTASCCAASPWSIWWSLPKTSKVSHYISLISTGRGLDRRLLSGRAQPPRSVNFGRTRWKTCRCWCSSPSSRFSSTATLRCTKRRQEL